MENKLRPVATVLSLGILGQFPLGYIPPFLEIVYFCYFGLIYGIGYVKIAKIVNFFLFSQKLHIKKTYYNRYIRGYSRL